MVILGIDPGYAIVGYGAVEYARGGKFRTLGYGAITTKAGVPLQHRLVEIYQDMLTLLDHFKPDVASIEELFFNTNATTAIVVAEARGVTLLAARQHGLKIGEYTPLQVKQAVVGYGRAEKEQVIRMVTTVLGLKKPPKPDDTADALAIAICHGHSAASRIGAYYNN